MVLFGQACGDVAQNYSVDLDDIIQIYNAASLFISGFNVNDLTGDRIVDLSDILIAYNNSNNFVARQAPPGALSKVNKVKTTPPVMIKKQELLDIQKSEESAAEQKKNDNIKIK